MGSELPVIGGAQTDPRQFIDMAPGISEGVGPGDFEGSSQLWVPVTVGWTLARIPSHGVAPSLMAPSPFALAPSVTLASGSSGLSRSARPSLSSGWEGPSPPASSCARPVCEAVVRGCWGNPGSVPRSWPPDFCPFPRSGHSSWSCLLHEQGPRLETRRWGCLQAP